MKIHSEDENILLNFSPSKREPKIKRNAPCKCGSGKRAKHCCAKYNPNDKKTKP